MKEKIRRNSKRIISAVIVLILAFGLIGYTTANAEGDTTDEGNSVLRSQGVFFYDVNDDGVVNEGDIVINGDTVEALSQSAIGKKELKEYLLAENEGGKALATKDDIVNLTATKYQKNAEGKFIDKDGNVIAETTNLSELTTEQRAKLVEDTADSLLTQKDLEAISSLINQINKI